MAPKVKSQDSPLVELMKDVAKGLGRPAPTGQDVWVKYGVANFGLKARKIRELLAGSDQETHPELDHDVEFPALCDEVYEPLEPLIEGLMFRKTKVVIAGMFESYKTIMGIDIADKVSGDKDGQCCGRVFEQFKVAFHCPVVYYCLDMNPALFDEYARPWNLRGKGKRLRVRRSKSDVFLGISSDVLKKAVQGSLLILDTMWDFANIKEAFQSAEWVTFFRQLDDLIRLHGCEGIIILTHPNKSSAKSSNVVAADFLKDSVTFGGKIDGGYAASNLEGTSLVYVERIKGRGFKDKLSFRLSVRDEEGNSFLDRGMFPVWGEPNDVKSKSEAQGNPKGGNPGDPERQAKMSWMEGKIKVDVLSGEWGPKAWAEALDEQFPSKNGKKHKESTVKVWLSAIRNKDF